MGAAQNRFLENVFGFSNVTKVTVSLDVYLGTTKMSTVPIFVIDRKNNTHEVSNTLSSDVLLPPLKLSEVQSIAFEMNIGIEKSQAKDVIQSLLGAVDDMRKVFSPGAPAYFGNPLKTAATLAPDIDKRINDIFQERRAFKSREFVNVNQAWQNRADCAEQVSGHELTFSFQDKSNKLAPNLPIVYRVSFEYSPSALSKDSATAGDERYPAHDQVTARSYLYEKRVDTGAKVDTIDALLQADTNYQNFWGYRGKNTQEFKSRCDEVWIKLHTIPYLNYSTYDALVVMGQILARHQGYTSTYELQQARCLAQGVTTEAAEKQGRELLAAMRVPLDVDPIRPAAPGTQTEKLRQLNSILEDDIGVALALGKEGGAQGIWMLRLSEAVGFTDFLFLTAPAPFEGALSTGFMAPRAAAAAKLAELPKFSNFGCYFSPQGQTLIARTGIGERPDQPGRFFDIGRSTKEVDGGLKITAVEIGEITADDVDKIKIVHAIYGSPDSKATKCVKSGLYERFTKQFPGAPT